MSKTNYQVSIGYRAVINVNIKAENEAEAKKVAIELMKTQRYKMFRSNKLELQDDRFAADGILNMDETWNQL